MPGERDHRGQCVKSVNLHAGSMKMLDFFDFFDLFELFDLLDLFDLFDLFDSLICSKSTDLDLEEK